MATLTLTSRLRTLRTVASFTQEQLAAVAGVSSFTISRMESGSPEADRVSTAARLARALGTSIDGLYDVRWTDDDAATPEATPVPLAPLARACEARGCVDGRLTGDCENPSGDPRGPAEPAAECPDCGGTGELHIFCAGCNMAVPWALTTPDPDSGEALCPGCANPEPATYEVPNG